MIPWVITMSIAATRMYRSLSNSLSSDVYVSHSRFCLGSLLIVLALCHNSSQKSLPIPKSGRTALETNGTPTSPVILTGIQVAVHKAHEQPYKPQENYLATNITEQTHVKPHELTVGLGAAQEIVSCEV